MRWAKLYIFKVLTSAAPLSFRAVAIEEHAITSPTNAV